MMEKDKIDESKINAEKLPDQSLSNESPSPSFCNNNTNVELNFLRKKLEDFRMTILKDVEHRMADMIEEVVQELRQHKLQHIEFRNFGGTHQKPTVNENIWVNRIRSSKEENFLNKKSSATTSAAADVTDADKDSPDSCPVASGAVTATADGMKEHHRQLLSDKIFVTRDSYLTALLQVNHIQAIYHIFFVIFVMLLMNTIFYDYFVDGRINFGLGNFKTGFEKIHYVFFIWCLEHLVVFTLYYAFKGWAQVRLKLLNQKHLLRFWNNSCLIVYISSQLLFLHVASVLCPKLDLPFISASVLLLESARLLMKMHAFVRPNVARILAGKNKAEGIASQHDAAHVCSFSSYLYFLFAPTLIYRDHYPRTNRINWRFAALRFLEVVAIAFLYSYIHERYIKPNFSDYGREPLNASAIVMKIFSMAMPNMIIFLCGFYLVLHSWQNFTAELLRFGDRMFYKDWWTATSYDAYYRNWNVVVHDWLYEFVYRECYNHLFRGSKVAAALTVFVVSALVHEYLLSYALQMFFPVMFVFFIFAGVPLVFLMRHCPTNIGNVIFWLSLSIGNGLMITLYCMEYYARFNCPKQYDAWTDYLIPALWTCNKS